MNEVKLYNSWINIILKDLVSIIEVIKGNTIKSSSIISEKLEMIKSFKVPEDWLIGNLLIQEMNINHFIKILLIKQDFIKDIVFERKCEIPPILHLGKMMDPFSVFTNSLWMCALQSDVINDL